VECSGEQGKVMALLLLNDTTARRDKDDTRWSVDHYSRRRFGRDLARRDVVGSGHVAHANVSAGAGAC
jgi:hypothetical protein